MAIPKKIFHSFPLLDDSDDDGEGVDEGEKISHDTVIAE